VNQLDVIFAVPLCAQSFFANLTGATVVDVDVVVDAAVVRDVVLVHIVRLKSIHSAGKFDLAQLTIFFFEVVSAEKKYNYITINCKVILYYKGVRLTAK